MPYEPYFGPRYQLAFSQKFKVLRVDSDVSGLKIVVDITGPITLHTTSLNSDIRAGEMVQLYMELPIGKRN